MSAHILFRKSSTPQVPSSDYVKGAPLTSLEIDGNFKSLKNAIESLQLNTGTGTGTTTINSTNLSLETTASTVTIKSDTGTDVVINEATKTRAGILSAADKIKIDNIGTGTGTGTVTVSSTVNSYLFDSDGQTKTFALAESVSDKKNTQIFNNGIYQEKSTYDIVGTTLTFDAAPIAGKIEVIIFSNSGTGTTTGTGTGTTTINSTNLSLETTASTVTIKSDTGTDVIINEATDTRAGILSAADKIKINNIGTGTGTGTTVINSTNLGVTVSPSNVIITSDTGNDATISLVTTTNAGVMSPTDKIKLDNLNGGTTSNKLRIAVIGDSLTAHTDALHEAWPSLLEKSLIAGGLDCEVFNLAILGHTFELASNENVFGSKSQVEQAIELKADVVIVVLGANDTITAASPKTNAAIQTDASNVFSALRTGLPNAKLIYGREIGWDSTHKPTGKSLLNKHVAPAFMGLRTSGYLANCYSSQILDDPLSYYATRFSDRWMIVDSYIRGLSTIDGTIDLDHFKCARLGAIGEDGIHLTANGAKMFAGWVRKAFNNLPALQGLTTSLRTQTLIAAANNAAAYDDPDEVFKLFCTSNPATASWTDNAPNSLGSHISTNLVMLRGLRPHVWYMPSKGALTTGLSTINQNAVATWTIENTKPNSTIFVSQNESVWIDSTFKTSPQGNATIVQPHGQLAAGANKFYAKIDNEVYGPYNITVTAATSSTSTDYIAYTGTSIVSISTASFDTKIVSWSLESTSDTISYSGGDFLVPTGTWVVTGSLGLTLTAGASAYAIFKPTNVTASALSTVTCSSAHNYGTVTSYGLTAGSSIIHLTSDTYFSFYINTTGSVTLNKDKFAHKLTFHKIA